LAGRGRLVAAFLNIMNLKKEKRKKKGVGWSTLWYAG
jgi:hypothetical protein